MGRDRCPIDSAEVNQVFASALNAQPRMPQHFMLYFKFDKDELTPESKPQYQKVFEDIKARPVYEVEVIGYTDTMGQQKYNQELSLHRADAIRQQLIHDGLDPKSIRLRGAVRSTRWCGAAIRFRSRAIAGS